MTETPPEAPPARGRTAYIHVGPHKTGSSSIKHYLRGNIERLGELGLFFPLLADEHGRPARNHEDLAKVDEIKGSGELKARAKLWPEIDAVARRGEQDILLQSEMFCRSLGDADMFGRILTFFEVRGYRVVILAYVRDQPAWLNSWYVQSQKRLAELMTFEEFVADADDRGRVEPWVYLKKFIDEPRCELQVVSFEQAAKAGLEEDFIRRCGVPDDAGLVRNELRNPNAGAKSIHAAQEIMRRSGSDIKDLPGYAGVCNAFKRRYVSFGWERTPYVALTAENVAKIRERYAESNESFAQAFFGRPWVEVCPPRPFETSVFDPASATWLDRWRMKRIVRSTVIGLAKLRADVASGRKGRKPKTRDEAAFDDA